MSERHHQIPDFKNNSGVWAKSRRSGAKAQHPTKSGSVWTRMRDRCFVGGYQQRKHARYAGCYMSDDFWDFQKFVRWFQQQKGYEQGGYHLDKDLLVRGNKCYSSETCCYIPAMLNMFLVNQHSSKSNHMIGAHYHTRLSKWGSSLSVNGEIKFLGYFESELDAHREYVVEKELEAKRWANRLINGEFPVEDKVIEALLNWKVLNTYEENALCV
jgi:hypothetical protein